MFFVCVGVRVGTCVVCFGLVEIELRQEWLEVGK